MFWLQKLCVFATLVCYAEMSNPTNDVRMNQDGSYVLEPLKAISCCPENVNRNNPIVYCYKSARKELRKLWMTVEVWMSLNPDQYEIYWGEDHYDIRKQFYDQSLLKLDFSTWRSKNLTFNPFNSTCFGIYTSHDYQLELFMKDIDKYLEVQAVVGLFILLTSEYIASSHCAYYTIGQFSCSMLSLLLVFYLIISLLPFKRASAIGVFLGGGTILMYYLGWMYSSLSALCHQYKFICMTYLYSSVMIGYGLCYYYGPPSDRTVTLSKWVTQAFGAMLMYTSTYYTEAMIVIIGVCVFLCQFRVLQKIFCCSAIVMQWFFDMLLWLLEFILDVGEEATLTARELILDTINLSYDLMTYLIRLTTKMTYDIVITLPGWTCNLILSTGKAIVRWIRSFRSPPPRRFLTMAEYRKQGRIETKKAIDELIQMYNIFPLNDNPLIDQLSQGAEGRVKGLLQGQQLHVREAERASHAEMYPDEYLLTDDEGD